jgi:DNA-binding transcriptional ArsR family regulator
MADQELAASSEQPSGMDAEEPTKDVLRVHHARDIRALAHPARVAIIDALASGDELTATECAKLTGLSPSATAYHLKFLERHGFVEAAGGRRDGRQRPWRAPARPRTIDLDPVTAAGEAAAVAVADAHFEQTRQLGDAFMATMSAEPEEWRLAARLSNSDVWLTADEAAEVGERIDAVIDAYRGRTIRDRPDASRRVRVTHLVIPHTSS